jgi:hypothetical protein
MNRQTIFKLFTLLISILALSLSASAQTNEAPGKKDAARVVEKRNPTIEVAGQIILLNLNLPMPSGVAAERFEAALEALIVDKGVEQRLTASKSGKITR